MSFGIDYVSGPSAAQLRAANVTFACRYLSYVNSLTQVKLLTPSEAQALSAAGIALVSNYEWYANRALEGFASGVQDAQIAAQQHAQCGGASDRPIYFSVDADVAGEQVLQYFKGVASVIGAKRTGAYGSYRVLKYLFDVGAIAWGWQTYAWSYGAWESRAHIEQYQNGVTLNGHSVDFDRSTKTDFGQWFYGKETQHSMATINVPLGWRDDGKTLWSPNDKEGGPEVPIAGLIRSYLVDIEPPQSWPRGNVALGPIYHIDVLEENNPALGPGWQQAFRYALLCIPDTGNFKGKVVYQWDTRTLLYLRSVLKQQAADNATLKQQIAAMQTALAAANTKQGVPVTDVNARLASIAALTHPY